MKKVIASLVVLALVSGCAAGPSYHPTPFDHASSGVSTIQVIDHILPAQPRITKLATNGENMMNAASGAGLAGLLVVAVAGSIELGVYNDQNTKVNAALATQNIDAEALFETTLQDDLKAQNFQVSTVAMTRPENRTLVVVAPQKDAPAGSAVLDVNGSGYGYQYVGGPNKWRPYVSLQIHMVDAKDPTKVLLDNFVTYNAVVPSALTVNIPLDDTYAFSKVEEIQADPKKAADGIRAAIVASAHATAQLLK